MKPDEKRKKTFFDLVTENAKLKDNKPPNSPTPPGKGIVHAIGWIAGFFLFGLMLHLGASVLAQKTIMPTFSYIEILELYAAALVLRKQIFK